MAADLYFENAAHPADNIEALKEMMANLQKHAGLLPLMPAGMAGGGVYTGAGSAPVATGAAPFPRLVRLRT